MAELSCNLGCRDNYARVRATLNSDQAQRIAAWSVEGPDRRTGARDYRVLLRDRTTLWEGKACCRWDARKRALESLNQDKGVLVGQLLDRMECKHERDHYRNELLKLSEKTIDYLIYCFD